MNEGEEIRVSADGSQWRVNSYVIPTYAYLVNQF